MKINIELDGIQEGKNYTIDFCVNGEKVTTRRSSSKNSSSKQDKKDDKKGPSIEDFEKKEKSNKPTLETPKVQQEFKVESSFGDKLSEGDKV